MLWKGSGCLEGHALMRTVPTPHINRRKEVSTIMKSITKLSAAVAVAFVATTSIALAVPADPLTVPEPGAMSLVGLAIAGVLAVSRKSKAK